MKMLCTTDFVRGGKTFFTAGLTYPIVESKGADLGWVKLEDDDGTPHTLIGPIIQRYFIKDKEEEKKDNDLWSYYHGI